MRTQHGTKGGHEHRGEDGAQHDVEPEMRVRHIAGRKVCAGVGDERDPHQRAVEPEQPVLDHSLVGLEPDGCRGPDDGAEQADGTVDPGVVKDCRQNHRAGDWVVLEDHLPNPPQHPVDKSKGGMVSVLVLQCHGRQGPLLSLTCLPSYLTERGS